MLGALQDDLVMHLHTKCNIVIGIKGNNVIGVAAFGRLGPSRMTASPAPAQHNTMIEVVVFQCAFRVHQVCLLWHLVAGSSVHCCGV